MKLIVVSNKLPISIHKTDKGEIVYKKSAGGVVKSIENLSKHMVFVWVGAVNNSGFSNEEQLKIKQECSQKFNAIPVFVPNALYEQYYLGFCEQCLGPALLGYYSIVSFNHEDYNAFKKFNQMMTDAVLENAEEDDIVWVHDFTQILMPMYVKNKKPSLNVIFFLHISFCEYHLLKPLVCIHEIIECVSNSNIIGFLTPEYQYNFIQCAKIEGFDISEKTKTISIGVDPESLADCLNNEETKSVIAYYTQKYAGKKIILGVDRTDYIKGLPYKVDGFKRYLEMHPEMKNSVIFLQIAVPCRAEIKEYQTCMLKIEEEITEINGAQNCFSMQPANLLYDSVNLNQLSALYSLSDIILVTSVIDGFNIVVLEYLACQVNKKGVVLISKFAGVADTLPGAIVFNPCNTEEVAQSIDKALNLVPDERIRRYELNKTNLLKFTAITWAEECIEHVRGEMNKK